MKRSQTALAFWLFMGLGVASVIFGLTISEIQGQFHLSAAVVGSVATFFAVGRLIGSVLGGGALARSGARRTILWSTLITMAGLAAYGGAVSWWVVLAASFVIGYGFGSLDVVLNAAVVVNHPEKRGLSLSLLHACYGVGAFVGPFALAWLLNGTWGWRSISWAVGLLFVFGLLVWVIIGFSDEPVRPALANGTAAEVGTPGTGAMPVRSLLREKIFVLAGLIGFIYQGISWALSVWLPTLLLNVHQVSNVRAAAGISALFVGITLGRVLNSLLGESMRFPYTQILFTGAIVACASLAASLVAPTYFTAIAGVFLTGIGLSIMVPLALAVITTEWPHAVGTLSGVFATLSAAGIIFWPWALGALSDFWGFQAGLGGGVVVLLALIVVTKRLHDLVHGRIDGTPKPRIDA